DLCDNAFKEFQDPRANYTTPAFRSLRSIKTSGNFYYIGNLRYFANKSLEQFFCNKCDIRELQKSHFIGLQKLKWIDLTLNGLTDFDLASLEGLPNLLRVLVLKSYIKFSRCNICSYNHL
ncbi:hypothetical protein TrispH2_011849, partial [Trichoplax sp. H2]